MIGLKKRVMALVVAFVLSFSLVQNIGASLFTFADATDGDAAEFSEMEGTKMPFNTFANETDAVTEEYEELQRWAFDSDVSGWKKGGYWTSAVMGGEVNWNKGLLGLTENFTACTGTWNQTSINVSITKGQFAEAAKVTFDYYTTDAPSRLIMVFAGSVEGTYTKEDGTTSKNPWANAQQTYMFTDVAADTGSTVEIDSVTYKKYSVTLTVDDNTLAYGYTDLTSAQVRKYASSFTLGEIRTDNTYAGSVFFDNVSVMKKKTVTAGVTLDAPLAVYDTAITAVPAGIGEGIQASYAWYVCTNAAGENAAQIDGEQTQDFIPGIEHIGGWIYCTVTVGEEQLTSNKVRVAASPELKTIELPVSETKIGNYDLALLNNTTDTYGKIEKTKWAAGGYIRVEYSGITGTEPADLPTLNLGTWSSSRESSAATNAKIPVVIEKLKTLEKEYPFVTYIEEIYDEFLDVMSTDSVHSKDSYVMSDGLHPVAEGYAIYAKYLKPLLSKASAEDDATLASLSYRMSGDFQDAEAKKVVDGFVSGKAANANGYDVVLPVGTASDATFRLYVQASNIACGKTDVSNAAVTVDGQPLTLTDEYGNGYAQITLADGKKTVTVTVTAADGTTQQS